MRFVSTVGAVDKAKHWSNIGTHALRFSVRISTELQIRLVDARFLYRQGLPATRLERAIAHPALAWDKIRQRMRGIRQDLLFERFTQLHPLHYGPKGRGYSTVAPASAEERMQRYSNQTSRLQFFVETYPDLMRFRDGESFLDLGCGTGQNIRVLSERYPSSRIVGYDLNPDAVALIQECESHPGVVVDTGDMTDDAWRVSVLAEGFDHIVVSHVFSLIFERSLMQTISLRRRILSDLANACRSSLVIVDTFGSPERPTITIEQRQRATVSDDVLGYFSSIPGGRTYLVQSDLSRAVVFVKEPIEIGGSV